MPKNSNKGKGKSEICCQLMKGYQSLHKKFSIKDFFSKYNQTRSYQFIVNKY